MIICAVMVNDNAIAKQKSAENNSFLRAVVKEETKMKTKMV